MDRARGPATGLNRTGKSCRLRWVNYLHPGLKRGRMSPQEQRLVLQLHSQLGNRWSRIARKLPGRTDNEIKNYWRTHMRKKAQERKRNDTSSSSSPSSSTSLSCVSPSPTEPPQLDQTCGETSGCCSSQGLGYSMDQIWNEIAMPGAAVSELSFEGCRDEACCIACPPMPSPLWEYSSESLWKLDEEMFPSMGDFEVSNYHHCREPCC